MADTGRNPAPLQRLSTRKVYVVTRRLDAQLDPTRLIVGSCTRHSATPSSVAWARKLTTGQRLPSTIAQANAITASTRCTSSPTSNPGLVGAHAVRL